MHGCMHCLRVLIRTCASACMCVHTCRRGSAHTHVSVKRTGIRVNMCANGRLQVRALYYLPDFLPLYRCACFDACGHLSACNAMIAFVRTCVLSSSNATATTHWLPQNVADGCIAPCLMVLLHFGRPVLLDELGYLGSFEGGDVARLPVAYA